MDYFSLSIWYYFISKTRLRENSINTFIFYIYKKMSHRSWKSNVQKYKFVFNFFIEIRIEPLNCYKQFHTIRIVVQIQKYRNVNSHLILYLRLTFQLEEQTSVDRQNPLDWNGCRRKCTCPTRNNGWSFAPRRDIIFAVPNIDQIISTNLLLYSRINREILKLRFISFVSKNVPILYI